MSVQQQVDVARFRQQWRRWHRRHEAVRTDPHGFLAITGRHVLSERPQRFDGVPGAWRTGSDGVSVEVTDDERLVADGITVRGRHGFGVILERGGVNATAGDAVIEVAKRGGYDIVRPRDPRHPTRLNYPGTPAFPPDPRWVVAGTYVPFAQARPTTVGSVVEELWHVFEAPGRVDFEIDGQPLHLTAFNGYRPGTLSILFTDATSGVTTYPASRSLQVDAPAADGTVTLDFNRATNLPCAYTRFAHLPPAARREPPARGDRGRRAGSTARLGLHTTDWKELTMPDVVVLVGNPRPDSRTRILAEATAAGIVSAAADTAGLTLDGPRILELAEIGAVSFGPDPARPSTVVDDPHGVVRRARLLVVGTPTYKGTYTGLLKVFLDRYGHRELAGVVAVPVAVAAAEPHLQTVTAGLEALLGELGATVPVPALAVLEQRLTDPKQLAAEWVARYVPSIVDAIRAAGP